MFTRIAKAILTKACLSVSAAIMSIGFACASTDPVQEVRKSRRSELLPCHTLAVTRTFLGVSADQLGWSEHDWLTRFEDLRSLGFSEVILEYSSSNELELFVRSMPQNEDRSPIAAMTRAASKTGVRVWMGLHRDRFNLADANVDADAGELSDQIELRLHKIEDRLYPLLLSMLSADPNRSVYRGWYMPDVVDSESWIDPDTIDQMTQYLYGLKSMLERLQPDWPVMMSAVLNNNEVDPEHLIQSWERLASAAGVNVFLFEVSESAQSGAANAVSWSGEDLAADTDMDVASRWLKLVSGALEHEHMNVGATIRLFSRTEDGEQVRAASFSDLRQSLNRVRQFGREPLTVSPIPRHLLDENDKTSRSLRKRWIRDQKACRGTPSRLVMWVSPASG